MVEFYFSCLHPIRDVARKNPYVRCLFAIQRAESLIGNSVGRSPTLRGTLHFQPCRGAIKWMSPLQGYTVLGTPNVGLRPTLLTTPFQG